MINLTEYQTSNVQLSHDEARELASLTVGSTDRQREPRVIQRLMPAEMPGSFDIQPGPYVGRFSLSTGRVVDIASRFPFQDLVEVLGLGGKAALLREAAAPAADGYGLMDLVALAFVREAERIVGQGLEKSYEQAVITRPPYIGRPNVTAQLTAHGGRADRLITTASRLTADNPINRFVACAYRRLRQLSFQEGGLSRRLSQLEPVFRDIGGRDERPPRRSAVPARYREIHDLACAIVGDRTALPAGSALPGAGVLFNMTTIWERYVGDWLHGEYSAESGDVVHSRYGFSLTDAGPDRQGKVDFVVERGGQPVAVYDAKYRPWREWPATDEMYQLFMYASRLSVDRAVLVYPATERRSSRTVIGDVAIETITIPVNSSSSRSGCGQVWQVVPG